MQLEIKMVSYKLLTSHHHQQTPIFTNMWSWAID